MLIPNNGFGSSMFVVTNPVVSVILQKSKAMKVAMKVMMLNDLVFPFFIFLFLILYLKEFYAFKLS